MENLAVDEDVVAVQSLVLAKKTQEGVAAIAKINNDGTTTRVGPVVYQPSTYSYIHAPEPLAPDGSLWTRGQVGRDPVRLPADRLGDLSSPLPAGC